jgi:hypothetical protein
MTVRSKTFAQKLVCICLLDEYGLGRIDFHGNILQQIIATKIFDEEYGRWMSSQQFPAQSIHNPKIRRHTTTNSRERKKKTSAIPGTTDEYRTQGKRLASALCKGKTRKQTEEYYERFF